MDRYIVHSQTVPQEGGDKAADVSVNNVNVSVGVGSVSELSGETFIIQTDGKVDEQGALQEHHRQHYLQQGKELLSSTQFTKHLDSQFNDGVDNTTYIIDNNSSNSIDSVRIGNHNFLPVVDSSLYNISVAGGTQYTIEGMVNPALGNYIIETPAYIVEKADQQAVYIQTQTQTQTQTQGPATHITHTQLLPAVLEPERKEKRPAERKRKSKEEVGPFYCIMCNAEFNSSASLRFHSYHHNPKNKRFSCIGCEKAFEKDREKEEHELQCELNYTGTKYQCIFCDLPFKTPKNLRTHENKHRPVKKTKKYKHMCVCVKCNKAFDAIYTLKVHIKKIHGGTGKKKKGKNTNSETPAM